MRSAQIPKGLACLIEKVNQTFPEDEKLQALFKNTFLNTYETTLQPHDNGKTFVITGDIPAMWLRDSAAQIRPYLLAADDPEVASLITGVIKQQIEYVLTDAYANAFNKEASGEGHQDDLTAMGLQVWERKYEIDSLCYPIQLGYLFWKQTSESEHLDESFREAVQTILSLWKVEQHHEERSPYSFERLNVRQSDTLNRNGRGTKVAYTGMTWSGFRPSDDASLYGYLVPANMFAVVVLGYVAEMSAHIWSDRTLEQEALALQLEIKKGIESHAIYEHPYYGEMYAYEVDGTGRQLLMDDANVPSLLSAPYLGYCMNEDDWYKNTRAFLLTRENPFYYEGKEAKGIGSPHTPDHYIWHIALSMQGLTAQSIEEKKTMLEMIKATDGGTNYLHEGFNASNSLEYTREWFAWSNSLFSEFVLHLCGENIKGSPLAKTTEEA